MKFKQDDADVFNCMRTKAEQQTETATDTCPSSGQCQRFPLLLHVCSVMEKVEKGKRCCFETSREKKKKATEILRRGKRRLKSPAGIIQINFFKIICDDKPSNKKKRTPTQNDCLAVRQKSTVKSP